MPSDMKSEEKCTVCEGAGKYLVMQKRFFDKLLDDLKPCPAITGAIRSAARNVTTGSATHQRIFNRGCV